MQKSAGPKRVILSILAGLLIFELFDFLGGYDYIKAALYQPTAEIDAIISRLDLTDSGLRTFKATHPELESREMFNQKCDSHDAEIYVLGCYTTGSDKIHLYQIADTELNGIKESTAAHELLHATYHRLRDKTGLNQELKKYYDSLKSDNDIKESLKLYSEADLLDELHSRLGTEVKDLPAALEKHYHTVFNDQDKIVDYYNQYADTLKKHEKSVKELATKIETLKTEIEAEEARLTKNSSELNSRIENYNRQVELGQYDSIETITNYGHNLKQQIAILNTDYDVLNQKIATYNQLISDYNKSVIGAEKVFNSINSNGKTIKTINN